MDINKLNENQRKAVLQTDGPLLILAGAGSGKTRVITYRIAHLINNIGVPPYNIFAVTFTNKAAHEMKQRISDLIGPAGNSVFIKTFHSASVYILRNFGEKIGIPGSFTIYDQSDQHTVIKEILLNMRLDPKKIKPQMISSKISEIKNKTGTSSNIDMTIHAPDFYTFDFADLFNKYHETLKKSDALDFDDLLIKTVELFREAPSVLRTLQRKWNYVMVDEYQDTNYSQYLISKYLASAHRNICVVGDDDQSIYSWRGADISNILNFEKDYPDTTVITLEENYRSTEPIIKTAGFIIRNNIHRKEKNIRSTRGDGEQAIWCRAGNEYSEAEYVINSIISLKHRENYKNSDFAIFYRTNAQSRIFEDFLRKENIPYKVVGGLKFYDRKEIKDILAYLKFISNRRDSVSLFRIINTPSRGIGKATIERIRNAALINSKSLWEIIKDDHLKEKTSKGLKEFKNIIIRGIELEKDVPEKIKLSDFVNEIIDITGYRKNLEEDNSMESNTRLENINEFINSVIDFQISTPHISLDRFLQEISLFTTEDNPAEELDSTDYVTLMTVHNAKGLEFPVVFMTGMEENIFPHKFSIDTEEGIEEERRLCYVGITRAMDRIILTTAEIRRSYMMTADYREPSRFIFEIPEDHLIQSSYNSDGFRSAPQYDRSRSYHNNNYNRTACSKFNTREKVVHPKYGTGTILTIEGSGDNTKLTILFGSSKKTFLEKYTPLEKLN